jgi:hypothetical protein
MKELVFLFAISLTANMLHAQAIRDPGRPNPIRVSTRLRMLAGLEHESVKSGDPVALHARYKNVSSGPLTVYDDQRNLRYQLLVTDASGKEPPRTDLGEQWLQFMREPYLLHGIGPDTLEPSAEGGDFVIDVSKYYYLTTPGRYFVRIMFSGLDRDPAEPRPTAVEDPGKVTLEEAVSDPIPFTVTP